MEPRKIGPYRIEDKLGAGGMGEVFRAYDDRLDRWVAVKLIRPEALENVEARRRFRREARAAARLSHPTIVQIHDILESEEGDSIVMELVEGQTLSNLLAAGPIEISRGVRLAREIAEGLAEAHAKSIVHRDLKADNVMVTPTGHVKILDFGLAKRLTQAETNLSVEGQIVGTVHAMSPEQAQGFDVDHRSDLFSLGSLLYQTVTGQSPFRGESPLHTLTKIATFHQTPAHEVNPRVPVALSILIDHLLEKDPVHRPRTADEVASVLGDIAVGKEAAPPKAPPRPSQVGHNSDAEETLSRSPTLTGPPPSVQDRPTLRAKKAGAPPPRPRARPVAAISILFLLLGLLGTWAVLRRDQERLYVAVLQPQLRSSPEVMDSDLVASAVRLALIQALLSRQGISTPDPSEVDTVSGSAAEVAQALGVDEVITSSLTCDMLACQIELKRIHRIDGNTQWMDLFKVFPGDLLELTSVVAQRLRNGYPEHSARKDARDMEVRPEDYEEYLRLRQSWKARSADVSLPELLAAVTALERTSPRFLQAYLLEARIAQNLFTSSRRSEDLERAFDAVARARDLAPDDPRALFDLFNIALDGARPEQAEEALRALQTVEPGHGRLLAQEALLLEFGGQPAAGLARMRTAVKRHASWANLMDLARMEIQLGEFDAARSNLQELLKRSPGNYLALFQLANHEMTYGSLEQALELFEKLRLQAPSDVGTRLNIGTTHFGLAQYQEAARWFSDIVEQDPTHLQATAALAFTRFLLDERETAQALAARALLLSEESGGTEQGLHFLRAMALVPLGQDERAVAAVQRILPVASASPFRAWQAALIYAAVEEELSAKTKAREALGQGLAPQWFAAPLFDFLKDDPELGTSLAGTDSD